MSRIDQGSGAGAAAWSPRAHEEVGGLRRAITEHLQEAHLPAEVAPMMGEFLEKPALFGAPPPAGLQRLQPPPHAPPPGQIRDALTHARNALSAIDAASPQAAALREVVAILDEHLALKAELISRCASDAAKVG
ncbi:hypothetical protein FRC96_10280 [Lujinxingia vulgaris]|uniref:Uncharacterized protein n=1 Tax=Lujinxingia vulgaris TaxID=2600176 RepID=A0A5C6X550_9DELT|nr:hypothetical protein [Lujinxingia vulgaris]TXD36261.1 hypothetical protein FRC96_10280 [Lujinxingia vulgaris]